MSRSFLHAFGRVSPPQPKSRLLSLILQDQVCLRGSQWEYEAEVAAMPTKETSRLDALFWPDNPFDDIPKKNSASAWSDFAPHSADSFSRSHLIIRETRNASTTQSCLRAHGTNFLTPVLRSTRQTACGRISGLFRQPTLVPSHPRHSSNADVVQEHPWLLVETDHQHQKMSITLLLDDTPRHVPVAAQSYRPNPAFEDRRDSGFGDEDGDRQSDMSTSPSDDDGFAQNGLPESDWGMFAASSQWKAIVNRIAAAEELRLALGESFAEHDIVASTSGLTAFTGLVDVPTAVFTESAGSVELCNTTSLAHTGQQVSETATFGLDLTPPKGAPSVNIGVTGEADKVVERAVKKKKSNFRKCLSFMRRTFMGSCKGYRLG